VTWAVIPVDRTSAAAVITQFHYTRRFPSGWVRSYAYGPALIVFSIPANKNLEPFLFDTSVGMRELARLWAPDEHVGFNLTQALSAVISQLRRDVPEVRALVSFADPNQDHHGGVHQAASWIYTGQSTESRAYRMPDGTPVSRRAFHSGGTSRRPDLPEVRLPGKLRYVRCLDNWARKSLKHDAKPYPKPQLLREAA
jgi:hypothetical protein